MASTLRANVLGTKELQRDLQSLGEDLDRPIRDVLEDHAAAIADMARGFLMTSTKNQPPWAMSSAAEEYPDGPSGYYGSTLNNLSASVWTTHPGAPVWEWGGTIHPAAGGLHEVFKSHPMLASGHQAIVIPRTMPANRAADYDEESFEADMQDAVDRLIAEYGF